MLVISSNSVCQQQTETLCQVRETHNANHEPLDNEQSLTKLDLTEITHKINVCIQVCCSMTSNSETMSRIYRQTLN